MYEDTPMKGHVTTERKAQERQSRGDMWIISWVEKYILYELRNNPNAIMSYKIGRQYSFLPKSFMTGKDWLQYAKQIDLNFIIGTKSDTYLI